MALWLAAHQPMLVHSVITLGTKFAWSPQGAAHEIKFLDAEKMLSKVPAFAAELELRHAHTDWRTVVEKTTEMMRDLGEQPRLDAEMSSKIQCRVRVGVGDRDAMVTLEETRDAFKAIPRSEMYVLPGTEHPLERVNVLRWATVIRDFFISSTGK